MKLVTFGEDRRVGVLDGEEIAVLDAGRIVRVLYPVFPSDRNAQEVVTWLQGRE